MLPVASRTVASTSGRIPRRRTARMAIVPTATATVACSPARRAATVRVSRLARGRCTSRSPTVLRPSACSPSAVFAEVTASGASRHDGRGQRSGAAIISLRLRLLRDANACSARGERSPAEERA